MRSLLPVAFCFLLFLRSGAQHENGLVNWLDLKTMQEKYKESPKPVLIDFYTDWCGWCKHMMKTTYSDPAIAGYINQNFYPVKFNAEGKDTVEYQGQTYKPLSPAPRTPHEFAIKFLGERLSYPSTVFITNQFTYNLLVPGYLENKKLEPILVFMVENAWQNVVFEDFSAAFDRAFFDTAYSEGKIKFHDITELAALQKKDPRKVLVTFDAPFCNTCKVMNRATFGDPGLSAYLSKKYHLVKFDVTRTDTVEFQGQKFHTVMLNNFPFHGLTFRLAANRFALPSVCVLDENLATIDVLNYFQGAERLQPIVKFYGDDIFKKKTFAEFYADYQKKKEPPAGKKPSK